MRSVRDLPSNVKVGDLKREEGTSASDGSQLPDDKGDNNKEASGERREPDSSKDRHITYRMEGEHW